jgi:hypothetical protein
MARFIVQPSLRVQSRAVREEETRCVFLSLLLAILLLIIILQLKIFRSVTEATVCLIHSLRVYGYTFLLF